VACRSWAISRRWVGGDPRRAPVVHLDAEEIQDRARKELSSYKVPARIHVVADESDPPRLASATLTGWPCRPASSMKGEIMSRAEELQNATADEFWDRFKEVMGGPDGLMTYRYLGTQADLSVSEGGASRMTIRRDMRNPAGGLMAPPLSIAIANAAGVKGDATGVAAPVSTSVDCPVDLLRLPFADRQPLASLELATAAPIIPVVVVSVLR
jgi:hypothetical protein